MNRNLRGLTLGVTLAGGLLLPALAQHGPARADDGQVIGPVDLSSLAAADNSAGGQAIGTVDLSVLPVTTAYTTMATTATTTTSQSSTAPALPPDFTPMKLQLGN